MSAGAAAAISVLSFPSRDGKRISLGHDLFVQVDAADFEYLSQWSWGALRTSKGKIYARRGIKIGGRKGKNVAILMHRVLIGAPDWLQVDHINGDTLDNRKGNLRLCTAQQNRANTRPAGKLDFKGISQRTNGWFAQCRQKDKTTYAGPFQSPEAAARAYDKIAFSNHGNFAYLNFPAEVER